MKLVDRRSAVDCLVNYLWMQYDVIHEWIADAAEGFPVTIGELADQLRIAYEAAEEGKKVVAIHLFGIRYAGQLEGKSCNEVVVRAGIQESYATEIRKGMNLAQYVSVR